MSRCLGARVADLAGGRLEPAEAERAYAHVAACQSCRRDLHAQRSASSQLASSAPVEPSEDLLARLRNIPRQPAASVPAAIPPQGGAGRRPAGAAGRRPGVAAGASTRPPARRHRGRMALATAAGAAALAVVAVIGGGSGALTGAVTPRPAIAPVIDTLADEHAASADQMPFSGPRVVTVGFTGPAASGSPSPLP